MTPRCHHSQQGGAVVQLRTAAVASPVGNQTRVDVAVLALVALLCDSHLADGSPQSGQEQARDEQVGHHDSRALEQDKHKW